MHVLSSNPTTCMAPHATTRQHFHNQLYLGNDFTCSLIIIIFLTSGKLPIESESDGIPLSFSVGIYQKQTCH